MTGGYIHCPAKAYAVCATSETVIKLEPKGEVECHDSRHAVVLYRDGCGASSGLDSEHSSTLTSICCGSAPTMG